MKGIAHFISGTAAVQQSAHGAWVLALAGACALLPFSDLLWWRNLLQ